MRLLALALALALCPAASAAEQSRPASPNPESLVGQAAPLCDAAFAETAPTEGGLVRGPALLLFKGRGSAWSHMTRDGLAAVTAKAPEEVRLLVCIDEKVQGVGRRYTDGSAALGTNWAVRLLRFPEGRSLGAVSFFGYPPSVKRTSGPGIGSAPADELASWLVQTIEMRGLVTGSRISGLALAPEGDGALVFEAWELGERPIALWDLAKAERVLTLPHTAASAAVAPKGGVAATGGVDKTVRLWNLATRAELRRLTGHIGFVRPVAFSPDGSMLASISGDGIRLWDVASGRQLSPFRRPVRHVRSHLRAEDDQGRHLVA